VFLQSAQHAYGIVTVPTGCLVCLEIVQYTYSVFSVPTECLECLQDDECSYMVFSVPTDCSVSVKGLVFLQGVYHANRMISVTTGY
jgi:hypothetical protein